MKPGVQTCDYAEDEQEPEKECGEPAEWFYRGEFFKGIIWNFARCRKHGTLCFLNPRARKPEFIRFFNQYVRVQGLTEDEYLVAEVMDA